MKMMEKGMKKIYTADLIDNDLEDSGSEPDNE